MGFGLGSIGSIAGGILGAGAAGSGADAMSGAVDAGIQAIKGYDNRTRSDTQPYRNLGTGTTNLLSYLLGVSPTSTGSLVQTNSKGIPIPNAQLYASDPAYRSAWDTVQSNYKKKSGKSYSADTNVEGILKDMGMLGYDISGASAGQDSNYGSLLKGFTQDDLDNDVVYTTGLQFGLDQGTKSLNNRALAGGAYDSGSTLKALTKWADDYGTTKAEGAYNRFNTDKNSKYSMLTGGSTIGQNAVNTSAQSGQAAGGTIADLLTQQANAEAAGGIGEASGIGNALGGLGTLASYFI